ncbi:MAG: nucleotidyltransferase domain-containing protein [Lachnospiraceae bacterium]|nr:nucleotidyltransferase domain-containing protein [Lachnospiraceae bacterium]
MSEYGTDKEIVSMSNISEIQKAVVPIARHYGIKRLYLFGSYAKGTANEKSDIDLLVEKGKPMSLLQLSGMRQMVQEALQLSVDLLLFLKRFWITVCK